MPGVVCAQANQTGADSGQFARGSAPGQMPGPQYSGQYAGQQFQGVQGQPYQGQPYQVQPYQGQQYQGQPYQGQPYQGQPYQGQPYQSAPARKAVSPQQAAKVYRWFLSYDEVRHRAQMNPIEKQQADGLLARGLGLFMPGQDKMAAKQLLGALVVRYQTATQALQGIALVPETRQLQELYYQYFDTSMHLFSDYLVVQDNVFAVDASGQSVAKQLIQRKLALENLERSCKDLDGQVRQMYGVAPYQY